EGEDLLRAPERKHGYERLPAPRDGPRQRLAEGLLLGLPRRQLGLGVGAEGGFEEEHVERAVGVAGAGLDGLRAEAGVGGVEDAARAPALLGLEVDADGAEDVTGVVEASPERGRRGQAGVDQAGE